MSKMETELLEWAKLLESTIVYEMKRSTEAGDDEGARLKSFTLEQLRGTIARAKRRS